MVRRVENNPRPPASRTDEKPPAGDKPPATHEGAPPPKHGWKKEVGHKGQPDAGEVTAGEPGAEPPASDGARGEPRHGWAKEVGHARPHDAGPELAAENLVGLELVAAVDADEPQAFAQRFAAVAQQLRGMVATPRGKAALVALLGGFATRFLAMTTPLTPQQQQAALARFGDFLLFMGKSTSARTFPSPMTPTPAERRSELASLIAHALEHPAFAELVDERGRAPAETARELFTARDLNELEARSPTRFSTAEAQAKPEDPRADTTASAESAASKDAAAAQPAYERNPHAPLTAVEEEQARRGRGGRGRFTTWDPLGAFQEEDPQHLKKADNWNRVVLSALLILALGAVLIMVLSFLGS